MNANEVNNMTSTSELTSLKSILNSFLIKLKLKGLVIGSNKLISEELAILASLRPELDITLL